MFTGRNHFSLARVKLDHVQIRMLMMCNFGKKFMIYMKDMDIIDNRLHSKFKKESHRSVFRNTNNNSLKADDTSVMTGIKSYIDGTTSKVKDIKKQVKK